MKSEESNWHTEVIKRRYYSDYQLSITDKQAERIYEEEKETGSIIHHFSIWEASDYQFSCLKEILNGDQLEMFIENTEASIKYNEEILVQKDKDEFVLRQINFAANRLTYYNETLLPGIFNDYTLTFGFLEEQRPKLNYLKAEYKKYLEHRKKEIFVSHFRNSRRFQPNLLKLGLLNHKLAHFFPDYYLFKESMDAPTKSVKNYLKQKLQYWFCANERKITAIFQELEKFNSECVKKHVGEVPGWHTEFTRSEEKVKEYRLMCLVLLDRNKYGC